MYNIGMTAGEIKINSKVVYYTEDDVKNLKEKWIPTGTSYLSLDDRITMEKEREEKMRRESEELNKRLQQAHADKKEQERIKLEAERKKKELKEQERLLEEQLEQ